MFEDVFNLVSPITKKFEGLRLVAYKDPVGLWTTGYGHRCSANHPPITEEVANKLLREDLEIAFNIVVKKAPDLKDLGLIAALTDFTFNLGTTRLNNSTLLKLVQSDPSSREALAVEFSKWVYAGGYVLPGLVARRKAEVALFI